jgi:hypothetical protein
MNKFIEWFSVHWQQRVFKLSTACGLGILYLEIFHHAALNSLIDKIMDNPDFITALVGAITAFLIGTKKF